MHSLSPLPANEWQEGLTYPVSFVAHDAAVGQAGDVGQALAGGHVIANGSALDGLHVFADFSRSSRAFTISADDIFAAKTTLQPNEDPSELSWVTPAEAVILFNHDNDTATTPIAVRNFYDVMDPAAADDPRPRSDVRFGVGSEGEMYITNEVDGWVYIVENSTPNGFTLPGGDPVSTDPPPSVAVCLLYTSPSPRD